MTIVEIMAELERSMGVVRSAPLYPPQTATAVVLREAMNAARPIRVLLIGAHA